ncbi:efflux RND transporter permease subunit [Oleomonas cavernae]|uniref:Efflux RND transporter permease subunit n=1 Tax=Oleomonas cavernae TaxID=2320859 RepID=A0A418WTN1_9PROT|nr:efflux RND transporter permease subunit [Oleomonas cavernae]RJF94557.1 efflux RND transporter permease subunit [Oleomonas cavernae]
MSLSELCIRRPIFATVLSIVLILIGFMAYSRLTLREYPKIDEPVINIETTYRGASAEIIESQVTQPIEEALSGIEGIEYLSSASKQEMSQVTIRFRLDRDVDAAAADVRDRIGRARGDLPTEIEEPVISKVEADATPIMFLGMTSDRHNELVISDVADRLVKDRLQTLPGVAEVRVFGERRYAMRIWLDPAKLAAYEVTTQDVEDALRAQNVEVPGGRIEARDREMTVTSDTSIASPERFEAIIIREVEGYPVRIGDIGRARIEAEDTRVNFRINGKTAVGVGVIKQSTANPLDVSKAVTEAVPGILDALPQGMTLKVNYDSNVFIERSIDAVIDAIGEAVALVIIVIFIFLRSLRATLIPLVTIPVSLIGAFSLMLLFGFSINTLTLLAVVLAVGLVVDDAIVVMENIARHVEAGMPPFRAALQGSREIVFAVIAMTLTLVAVFTPVAFQEGRTGKLFMEFALTLAGAVLISGFVALTLSPMMSSLILRHQDNHGRLYKAFERGFQALNTGYRRALAAALQAPALVIAAMVVVGLGGFIMLSGLDSELSPSEDRGLVFAVMLGPEGATIDYTTDYAKRMEGILSAVPEVETVVMIPGIETVNQAIAPIVLTDWSNRSRSQQAIAAELGGPFFGLPGVMAFPINPPSLGQGFIDRPVSFVVQTSGSYEELDAMTNALVAEVMKSPIFTNVDSDLKLNKPELRIELDRDKASNIGLDVEQVGRTLESLLGGRQVTRYKYAGKQYDVIVQIETDERRRPDDIDAIYVRGGDGATMIPLSNVVTLKETTAPRDLNHFNKLRAATISGSVSPGYTLGEALDYLDAAAERILPNTAQADLSGISREYRTSSGGAYITFLLAIAFIFLVLAAQFESWVDPFIIMLSVPLAVAGALLTLLITGGTLNVYSQIGLVTLVGLITKHGILIVEFSNQIRDEGKAKIDAVIEAATLRLRPILMTTGAMVLGAVPLALATGAGAESRQQIGWVIVGGMSFGTLLTLFVVPTMYLLLARPRRWQEDEPFTTVQRQPAE